MLTLLLACAGPDDEPPPRSNTPPAVISVTLGPDPAYVTDVLTATASATDPDGDPLTLSYTWTVDGRELSAGAEVLPAGSATRGQTVTVEVGVSDGLSFGVPLSASIVLQNSAPALDSVAITPTSPGLGEDLSCTWEGSDADGDSLKALYTWNIDGVASAVVDAVLTEDLVRNTEVWCEAQILDFELGSAVVRSQTVVIGNSPPTPPGITLVPDPPTACTGGEVVVSSPSVDPDGDPLSYLNAWIDAGGVEVCSSAACGGGVFTAGATYTVSVQAYDGKLYSTPTTLDFTAVGGGETLGNGADDDCDGQVDEWITAAWQATQLTHSATASEELGAALALGDLDGDGQAEAIAGATGSASLRVWAGVDLLDGSARLPAPRYTVDDTPGVSVLAVGDVDGDGRGDLVVGAPGYDGAAGTDSGVVAVLPGADLADAELGDLAAWTLEGSKGQRLGDAVGLGDLDGDGLADLAVGSPLTDAPSREAGVVYVFYSPAGAGLAGADVKLEGGVRSGQFGTAVSVVGDLDGDGAAELVVGAPYLDDGGADAGAIGLWYGGALAAGYLADADLRVDGDADGALLGAEPAAGGDLDGDGLGELVLITQASGAAVLPGTVWVLDGASLATGVGLDDALTRVEASSDYAALGLYGGGVALGDVDGDGRPDLLAGAGGAGLLTLWRGATLLSGGALAAEDADLALAQEDAEDRFGRVVALGDVDGDGRGELLASAGRSSVQAERGGAVYLLRPPYGEPADPWAPDCEARGGALVCRTPASWADAAAACALLGWRLAEPSTTALNTALAAAAAESYPAGTPRGGFWIGLSDAASEGTWTWASSGAEASFSAWESGAPATDSARSCAVINAGAEGEWRDVDCAEERFYLCGG